MLVRLAMARENKVTLIPADPRLVQEQLSFRQIPTAAYARVSTELEEQQSSYDTQIAYYTDKIMRNTEWSLVDIYSDDGISGTQAKKRPGFMKMIADCQKGKIKQILVKSISRFARNTLESIHYIRMLKELGVAVIFEKERINTMDIDSETFITLQSCMAQAESESISGNIKWSVRKAFAQGKVLYSYKYWYGYEKGEDGQPTVIPEQADVVRRIFADYLNGHSLVQIVADLNGRGIRRKDGKSEWHVSAIQRMLQNERYCGDAISQKTYVKDCITKKIIKNRGEVPMYYVTDAHPAIVERAIFNRVQQEMARRSGKRAKIEKPNSTGRSKHSGKYALTDLLVCGECGTAYRRATWCRNGEKTIVWRCISRLTYGTRYCKHSPTLREDMLHAAIMGVVRECLSDHQALLNTLQSNLDITTAEDLGVDSPDAIEAQIRRLDADFMRLTGTVTESNMDTIIDALVVAADEIRRLKEAKAHAEQNQALCEHNDSISKEIASQIMDVPLDLNRYDDTLIRRLIRDIKVNPDGAVVIKLVDGRVVSAGN